MDTTLNTILWQQFGAAIDMLESAIIACPDEIWGDRSRKPEYWYTAFHVIFWLDYYLSDLDEKDFAPPSPYGKEEFDPAGIIPPRVYTRKELLAYLNHCRDKCRSVINAMTSKRAYERWVHDGADFFVLELHLYNMRHVQHHAAQLYLMLRQAIDSAPRWVRKAKIKLDNDK